MLLHGRHGQDADEVIPLTQRWQPLQHHLDLHSRGEGACVQLENEHTSLDAPFNPDTIAPTQTQGHALLVYRLTGWGGTVRPASPCHCECGETVHEIPTANSDMCYSRG